MTNTIPGPRGPPLDYEDEDKGVYELNQAEPLEETGAKESERPLDAEATARKKAALSTLKRVPKVVGSIDHAIMPMAPVRQLFPFSSQNPTRS